MNKWISAAVGLMLAGCGVDSGEPVGTKAPALQGGDVVALAHPPAAGLKPGLVAAPAVVASTTRSQVDLTVKLTGVIGAEGKSVRAVLGQMGCGFSTLASGAGTVENGLAQVRFPDLPANLPPVDLLVFLDSDGDGACTEADGLWQTTVGTQGFNSTATFDLGKLEAGAQWLCFAFGEG